MDESEPRLVPRFLAASHAPRQPIVDDHVTSIEPDTPTVRPFVVTGGRTTADPALRIESQLLALVGPETHSFESAALLELASTPISVAEASARLRIPIGAVKVLAADLAAFGALSVHQPRAATDPSTIRELIDAVAAL